MRAKIGLPIKKNVNEVLRSIFKKPDARNQVFVNHDVQINKICVMTNKAIEEILEIENFNIVELDDCTVVSIDSLNGVTDMQKIYGNAKTEPAVTITIQDKKIKDVIKNTIDLIDVFNMDVVA